MHNDRVFEDRKVSDHATGIGALDNETVKSVKRLTKDTVKSSSIPSSRLHKTDDISSITSE